LDRIRVSSIEPMTMDRRIIRIMARSERLCPYVHLCLQSGDDRILEAMRRPYTAGDFEALVGEIVTAVPGAGIGTDVMVGFPGETEEAFRNTLALLEALPFYHFHVFAYSEHPRTRSARFPEKVAPEVTKERSRVVRKLGEQKKLRFHERFVDRTLDVLFETRGEDGAWVGHAPNYARVSAPWEEDLSGRIARVRVERARVSEARGVIEEVLG